MRQHPNRLPNRSNSESDHTPHGLTAGGFKLRKSSRVALTPDPMTQKQQLHTLMASEGFTLHRRSKHLIWRDSAGIQIVTPASPSCHRHLKNIQRDIRRARCA